MLEAMMLVVLAAGAPSPRETLDEWTQPPASREVVAATAARLRDGTARTLRADVDVRKWLDAQLAHLRAVATAEAVSAALVQSALLDAMGFRDHATVLAAEAVTLAPDDVLALNNLGAIVCMPVFLRRAAQLAPRSPVVWTNLGSCAMSNQRWQLAYDSYTQALLGDPAHTNALIGLGQWALQRRDFKAAMGYFARAGGVSIRRAPESAVQRDSDGEPVPPDEPIEAGPSRFGDSAEEESGLAHATDTEMHFPPLPKWQGPDVFIASGPTRKALGAFYAEKFSGALETAVRKIKEKPLEKVSAARQRLRDMSPSEREEAQLAEALAPQWDLEGVLLGISQNDAWAKKKMQKFDEAYQQAMDSMKPLGKGLKDEGERRQKLVEAACRWDTSLEINRPATPGDIPRIGEGLQRAVKCREESKAIIEESCKRSLSLVNKMFALYNGAYQSWYAQAAPVLERLYQVQAGWIRQVGDPGLWELSVQARDTLVFGPMMGKMVEEDMQRLAFAGLGAGSFGLSAEVCPKSLPPALQPAKDAELPKTKPPPKCQLKKPIRIPPEGLPIVSSLVPFYTEVNCTEAEFGIEKSIAGTKSKEDQEEEAAETTGAGPTKPGAKAAAEVKAYLKLRYRFAGDKSWTGTVGTRAEVEAKAVFVGQGAAVSASADASVSITVDRNGKVTDVSGGASVGAEGSARLGAAKVSAGGGLVAAIEKGSPTITLTGEGGFTNEGKGSRK